MGLLRGMNPKVDWYFETDGPWQACYLALRELALDSGLTEDLKWGHPCYTLKGRNVFLIHGFNDYCALLFHKGALLKDDAGLLVQQTKNVQSARQLRFTSLNAIRKQARTIAQYMQEAIAIEQAGRKVALKRTAAYEVPAEFARRMKELPALKKAFQALTPGRQRGYLLHFAAAKQSATRAARVEKHLARILAGKGLDDRSA